VVELQGGQSVLYDLYTHFGVGWVCLLLVTDRIFTDFLFIDTAAHQNF
jgi:hypothetical protein